MKTKFTIDPTPKGQQFMQMCGVPGGLLAPVSLDLQQILAPINVSPVEDKTQVVPVSKQLEWFTKLREEFNRNLLVVVSSQNHFMKARQLSLIILAAHLKHALNHSKRSALPVWFTPTADFRNNFMEDYKAGHYSNPTLLIMDNVYADMPNTKLDKIRDMLQILCDRPRLVIYNGADPFQFSVNKLGLTPNQIINLGRHQQERRKL